MWTVNDVVVSDTGVRVYVVSQEIDWDSRGNVRIAQNAEVFFPIDLAVSFLQQVNKKLGLVE